MKSDIQAMSGKDWILLILLSLVWGSSFLFIEISLTALQPFTIVALRLIIAAAALQLYIRIRGIRLPLTAQTIPAFIIMGFLNNVVPFSFIVSGQQYITGSLASILNASTPFFTILVAHFFTGDEKIKLHKLIGLTLGFAGVFSLFGIAGSADGSHTIRGMIFILAADSSYACAVVYGRRFKRMGLEPTATATGQLSSSALLMLPIALTVDHPWNISPPAADVWIAVAGLALLSTALAYVLYFRILSSNGATSVQLVTFLVPVSAVILGALILGEAVELRHFTGMVLIGLGLSAVDGRIYRKRKKLKDSKA